MRGSDRRSGFACPPDGTGEGDTRTTCPSCGRRYHIDNPIATDPRIHRCPGCGRWSSDREPVCPLCGSPGELLGEVVIPGDGLYMQYRCRRCGNGFMRRIGDDSATRRR